MKDDDASRRAYWTSQLEEALAFVRRVTEYPVEECGERMASLVDAARGAGVRVEFAAHKHVRGLDRLYYLREGQIRGFLGAAEEMNRRGWVMRVEDGFRTRQMQKYLSREPRVFDGILRKVVWELGGQTPTPEFLLRRSQTLVALTPKTGTHMSGSAIDISVLRASDGTELDRGGPYIELSERTPMASPYVSAEARRNRMAITEVMRHHGFVEYPWEFWHYNGGDAYDALLNNTGKPGRYGAIDWGGPEDNTIRPIENPTQPLNTPEEMRQEIDAALQRLAGS